MAAYGYICMAPYAWLVGGRWPWDRLGADLPLITESKSFGFLSSRSKSLQVKWTGCTGKKAGAGPGPGERVKLVLKGFQVSLGTLVYMLQNGKPIVPVCWFMTLSFLHLGAKGDPGWV